MFEKVADIIRADTNDLKDLAKIAGGNPKTFYVGINLSGCSVRRSDLAGFETRATTFGEDEQTNQILRNIKISKKKGLDAGIDYDISLIKRADEYQSQGRYEEAEPLYRKGLEIRQRVLGEEHPDTATSYNNMASNLDEQGRYEEAEPLCRKGLEISQRVLGEEHPDTATSYNNVAYNLIAQGRYEEAEPLYRKGLEIRQRVLGEEHPDTASSYNNVAYNLNAQGRYEEAEPLYLNAIEILEKTIGIEHPDTENAKGNYELNRSKM